MIYIDTAEPGNIIQLIQQSLPVEVVPLNQQGTADYSFLSADGHTVQVNRTQAGELLSNIDSFEDELSRYYNSADEFYAIIEGIVSPYPISMFSKKRASGNISIRLEPKISPMHKLPPTSYMYTYSVSDQGFIYNEHVYKVSNKMFKAWLMQIDKSGITVFNTINYADTATTLVAFYSNHQKMEHSTLQRYYKPRVLVKERNPHIQALVNLSSAYKLDIGEVKAKAIIEKFGCLANLMFADRAELENVAGIGKKTVDRLYDNIGREW